MNTKARADEIARAAAAVLAESGADVTEQVTLAPLVVELRIRTGCHESSARRAIARAVRMARGEFVESAWGGDRRSITNTIRVRIDPAREMVIPVDPETRVLAQRLMLREWDGVHSVEDLFAYAVRRLAED